MTYDYTKLRAARQAARLSLGDVENITGFPQANVSRWEHGKVEPRVSNLIRLAKLYGVTVNEFVAADGASDE